MDMPLSNWDLDITTALRLIVAEDVYVDSELIPLAGEEEANGRSTLGLFERIVNGLTVSCRFGPLLVDSFIFAFPIMERILLSPKKTGLHDEVLQILYKHTNPILPLPRLRMISVLYHVLGAVSSYQAAIQSALNELCLGLQPDEVVPALYGVYAKDVHVRMACLNAVKCIPAVSTSSLPENIEVSTSLWIAIHDPEKSVAEAANYIWDRYGYDFGTDYSGLFKALSHSNYNVRLAAAEALAAALDEYPGSIKESLWTLFSLYLCDVGLGGDNIDAGWLGRQGIALALRSAADVLRTEYLSVVMLFLISWALADANADVRGRMLNAGITIIDKHGRDNLSLLFSIFENFLNKEASDEEIYDLVREGVLIFTGALAKYLAKDDPKVSIVVEKLLDMLNTPSEAVHCAVSSCLSPLMQSIQISHGTINCAVTTKHGVIVGVDSRSTVQDVIINDLIGRNQMYSRWKSDTFKKYCLVADGLCLTAAGDGARSYRLLGILEAMEVVDFDHIVWEINCFMRCEPVFSSNDSIIVLVVGFSKRHETYAIVSLDDWVGKTVFMTPGDCCAIGSGKDIAEAIFESKKVFYLAEHIEDFVVPSIHCLGYVRPGLTGFMAGLGIYVDTYFSRCMEIVDHSSRSSRYPRPQLGRTFRLMKVEQPVALPGQGQSWQPGQPWELAEVLVMVGRAEGCTKKLLELVVNDCILDDIIFSDLTTT